MFKSSDYSQYDNYWSSNENYDPGSYQGIPPLPPLPSDPPPPPPPVPFTLPGSGNQSQSNSFQSPTTYSQSNFEQPQNVIRDTTTIASTQIPDSYPKSDYDQSPSVVRDTTNCPPPPMPSASLTSWNYESSSVGPSNDFHYQQYSAYSQNDSSYNDRRNAYPRSVSSNSGSASYQYQEKASTTPEPYGHDKLDITSQSYKTQGKSSNASQLCSYKGKLNRVRLGSGFIGNSSFAQPEKSHNFATQDICQDSYKSGEGSICESNKDIGISNNETNLSNGGCTSNYTSPLMSMEASRGTKPTSITKSTNSIPNNKRPLPVELDPNLPQEIVKQLKNSSCDLCAVKLNSRTQAKTHYEGKPHSKKVKQAVKDLENKSAASSVSSSEDSSIDKSKAEPPPAKRKKASITDGSQLYCKCCDLSFTSTDHATQHYLGRNHQRVLHGLKPLQAGYYNKETGKWQRAPPDPRTPTERLGVYNKEGSNDSDSVKDKGKFFCELCGVSATSQDQLDGHLKGQRHKKNFTTASLKKNQCTASGPQDSILESVIKGDETKKVKSKDLSIFRTPSGKYYCSLCDLTLNSEVQFAQHVESKKHKLKKK